MDWNDIDGWFGEGDENIYYWMVDEAQDGDYFVEVGAWLGKSTICMAQRIKESGKRIQFDTIDTFKGSETEPIHQDIVAKHGGSIYESFIKNLEKCDVKDFVNPVVGDSLEVVNNYKDKSLKFVFLDTDHRYEHVVKEIPVWMPKVKPGGIFAGHDLGWQSVKNAVRDTIGLGNVETKGNIWWITIK